ncbi:hypothetical protein NliqN6_1496 [Naganishia liquefaciens]|uniref:Uncharacterized protein n=1 Tax=Naganishia liquefaciens TaxID=104408 RepID=A0A8H3TQH6_9TREE|nr:hypothetical protein NliqN6_1496 [Naganishia liquefaciens]
MPDGRMGRVKWLLITAVIIEILSLLVATSAIAPYVNQILNPFERVAKMVEIHYLMVIYFRCHPEEASSIAEELGIRDVQAFEDRMTGRLVYSGVEGKRKGSEKKRNQSLANDCAV